MHKRTRAVSISQEVKKRVWDRDQHECVLCHRWVPLRCACAHFVPRSQGGLGVEENIITLCDDCHREMDNGKRSKHLKAQARAYLEQEYGFFNEGDLKYDKWGYLRNEEGERVGLS